MVRRDKQNYYLDMAQVALERSTCLRRSFGAVIVKNDVIISTGYNGAPRGRANCIDLNYCIRQQRNVPRGTQYELCRAIHAEANAIIAASREEMIGSTLYLVGRDTQTGEIMRDAGFSELNGRRTQWFGAINRIIILIWHRLRWSAAPVCAAALALSL